MRAKLNTPQLLAAHENIYSDFDTMAGDALEWDIHYEQTGTGAFSGRLTQVVLSSLQLGRVRWSPGIIEHGAAPHGNWVVALPVSAEGTLHVRGRPASTDQALFVPAGEDIAFTANGRTDLMVAALHTTQIGHWMQARRGVDGIDRSQLSRSSEIVGRGTAERTLVLKDTLAVLMAQGDDASQETLSAAQSVIMETVLGVIPSFEVVEPLHRRAKVAVAMRALLHESLEGPITITDLCRTMAVRERTLYLACQDAYGKPPKRLLHELRLNAAKRQLSQPSAQADVTSIALRFGFLHLGRFAVDYRKLFGELPSMTLARARGERFKPQPGQP